MDWQALLNQSTEEAKKAQDEKRAYLENLLSERVKHTSNVDLSPMAALADSLAGTNVAGAVKAQADVSRAYQDRTGDIARELVASSAPAISPAEVLRLQAPMDLAQEKAKPKTVDPVAQLLQHEKLQKMLADNEKQAFAKTPQGKLEKLGAEAKGRLDNARMALGSVRDMTNALVGDGQNTFRIPGTGDNDFTLASKGFQEALGRMQSGGAISTEENKRFLAMRPTALDSPEIQKKKLVLLEKEMGDRLRTLGFTEGDLTSAGYSLSQLNDKAVSGLNSGSQPAAVAGKSLADMAREELARRRSQGVASSPVPGKGTAR